MAGFTEGVQRSQTVPFLDQLEDWIDEDWSSPEKWSSL